MRIISGASRAYIRYETASGLLLFPQRKRVLNGAGKRGGKREGRQKEAAFYKGKVRADGFHTKSPLFHNVRGY